MQPNERRIFYILILIAGLAWIGISVNRSGEGMGLTAAPQTGFPAPNFTLKTPQGETYQLSDLRGKGVLVNLWATWCPPCKAEMPTIEKIYGEYKDKGLVVLGINSTVQDDPSAIAPFIRQYNLTFPILLDETGEVSSIYELRSLPTSFFIGRDGVIREVIIGGPMSEALLRARVEEILK